MIYLIWERESYCDYDVIFITQDKKKAKQMLDKLKSEDNENIYHLEKRKLDKLLSINKSNDIKISHPSLNNGTMFC